MKCDVAAKIGKIFIVRNQNVVFYMDDNTVIKGRFVRTYRYYNKTVIVVKDSRNVEIKVIGDQIKDYEILGGVA